MSAEHYRCPGTVRYNTPINPDTGEKTPGVKEACFSCAGCPTAPNASFETSIRAEGPGQFGPINNAKTEIRREVLKKCPVLINEHAMEVPRNFLPKLY